MSDKMDMDLEMLEALCGTLGELDEAEAKRTVASPEGEAALRELADHSDDVIRAEHELESLAGQAALRELAQHSDEVIRQARRRAREAAALPETAAAQDVPRHLWSLTREAILARLAALRATLGGELAVAYRALDEQPTEDLRSLLADAEARLRDRDPESDE